MQHIIEMALFAMHNINQPQRLFLIHTLLLFSLFQGKANFTNLARYSNKNEKTFRRWFSRTFDFATFNMLMLRQQLSEQCELILAIDASFITKSGRKTIGVAKFWNGCRQKSEYGLEVSLLSVVDILANTAYALNAKQTIDVEKQSNQSEETRTDLYAQQVSDNADQIRKLNIKYLAGDSFYAKNKFIGAVIRESLHFIGKMRIDADLLWEYQGAYSGKGRPKKYDGKVKILQDINRFTLIHKDEDNVEIYSEKVYSKSLKIWVRVVLLHKVHKGKVQQALLFSTDTEIDPMKLVQYYKARFQIEFFFRDAKQFVGLTDCQARNREAIEFHLNASCSALNAMKLEDRKKKDVNTPTVISISSIKREKYNQHLLQRLFDKLEISLTNQKVRDAFSYFSKYGAIAA